MADFIQSLQIFQTSQWCQVAVSSLLVYEYFITFDQEVEFIWKRPWSKTTVLFVLLRYFGTGYTLFNLAISTTSLTSHIGKPFGLLLVETIPTCVIIWVAQIILQMRLYALYKCSKKLLLGISMCFIAEVVVMLTIVIRGGFDSQAAVVPIQELNICILISAPSYLYGFWFAQMTFESIMLLLALWAGYQRVRGHGIHSTNRPHLLDVLVEGNFVYFAWVMMSGAVNAIMARAADPIWLAVPEAFPGPVAVFAGSRLILEIRRAVLQGYEPKTPEYALKALTQPSTSSAI